MEAGKIRGRQYLIRERNNATNANHGRQRSMTTRHKKGSNLSCSLGQFDYRHTVGRDGAMALASGVDSTEAKLTALFLKSPHSLRIPRGECPNGPRFKLQSEP